jgi:hypothetical protein
MTRDIMDPGDWFATFNQLDSDRHAAPTVEGIDYPKLGVRQAHNDAADGVLTIETYAATCAASGDTTSWRVIHLPDAQSVAVERDGRRFDDWRQVDENAIEISCAIASHTFRIRTGWASSERHSPISTDVRRNPTRRFSSVNPLEIVTASRAIAAGVSGCPCCA